MLGGNAMEHDSVYDRIVQYLFHSGDIQPGDRVVETHLAAHLGVSRIPVREALGRLRGQGLLVSDGRSRGLRLRRYSLDDISQFYDYREVLEGGAARAAAHKATPEDLAKLGAIHERTIVLAEKGGYECPEWFALDHGFHATLAEASHNERIARSAKHLLAELHGIFYGPMYHRIAAARGRKMKRSEASRHAGIVLREHKAMIVAVRSGDAVAAERRARQHVRHASRRLRDAFAGLAAEAGADLTSVPLPRSVRVGPAGH